jgi:HSP20 family protein
MKALSKWKPFWEAESDWPFLGSRLNALGELERMQRNLGSLFGSTPLRGDGGREEGITTTEWAPLVDISEDDKEYLVKADLPELKKDEVKLRVENGVLTLSGERKFQKEEKTTKHHRVERAYGSFTRSFSLPDDVEAAKVNAEFKDGVLKVHLPKSANSKPKSIEIKVT